MQGLFILALAGATSLGAYFFGVGRLRLERDRLGAAVGTMLAAVGTIVLFLALNLAAAVTVVIAVRGVTGTFVSVYDAVDLVWVGLSVLQGLVFHSWRESSTHRR
jgi:hypothetical protein